MHACKDNMQTVETISNIYDQKIFMNAVVGDESWVHHFEPHLKISSMAHQKCKKALYCHKDYQCEKGYVCHIFHY